MEDIFFTSSAGRIEGRFTKSADNRAPAVLVLHPHPLYGGTMNNTVVHNIFNIFVENGFSVLKINFRGVGKSAGKFDNGIGELSDAASAMDWLHLNSPLSSKYWIAGFSFGSWIGTQLMMRRPEITNFVAISPPVKKYDFSFLTPCPIPGLIIQGNNDSIVSEEEVLNFVDNLMQHKTTQIDCKIINGADHFFRTKIDEMRLTLSNYIKSQQNNNSSLSKSSITENDDNDSSSELLLDDFL